MKKHLIIDAISNIDEDIIQKYFITKKELKEKRSPSNKLIIKWASSIAACIMLLVSGTIILQHILDKTNTYPDITTDNGPVNSDVIDNSNNSNDKKDLFEKIDNCEMVTVFDCYPVFGDSSFLKFKINKIYDGIYTDPYDNGAKFILLECTVVGDYYNKIANGTSVIIPIHLSNNTLNENNKVEIRYYDENEIKKFFSNYEYIFAHLLQGISEYKNFRSTNSNEIVTMDSVSTTWCSLYLFDIIPIKNNKVDLTGLENFLNETKTSYLLKEEIFGFTDIIGDGMEEEQLIENITQMYNYLSKKK